MADEKATLRIRVDGQEYVAAFSELNGIEAREFRRAVGVTASAALAAVAGGHLDALEYVAGWKWITERRDDPTLKYEDVLGSIKHDSWEFVQDEEEEAPDPTHGVDSAPISPPSPTTTGLNPGSSTSTPTASLTSI